MRSELVRGAYVTLITPFMENGDIDTACIRKLVSFQIENGVRGICPMGVTGETAALTDDEKLKVIELVVQEVNGRVQVIPDVGTECYTRTLRLAKECEKMGVDAIIVFTPYLDLPTVPGLYKYYHDIADSLNTPMLLHNVPGRTNVDMSPELISRLADHQNIIGIKDGNTNLEHVSETVMLTKGKDFSVLTGKDTLGYPLLRLGGHGHISVAANLIPDKIVKIIEYSGQGNFEAAQDIYNTYYDVFRFLYVETNPIPVKYAMNKVLFNVGTPRIPLTPMSKENAAKFDEVLEKFASRIQPRGSTPEAALSREK